MTANFVKVKKRIVAVGANTTANIIDSTTPVTIRTSAVTGGITRLDSLHDVDSSNEENGAVPVYNAETDKYDVRKLDLNHFEGNLDGGTF